MNCRVKTLTSSYVRLSVLFILSSLVFLGNVRTFSAVSGAVVNNSATEIEKDISNSPRVVSYPPLIYKIMTTTSRWKPSEELSPLCDEALKSRSFKDRSTDVKTNDVIPSPEVACRINRWLNPWESFKANLFIDFDVFDQARFKRVQFELQDNLKIRGLTLFQKNEQGKMLHRPLVILRMGIHGNVDEFLAERFLAKIYYENLKYHVLVLESLTSHAFLKLNQVVTIGGIEEGLHTFFILQLIKSGELSWAQNVSQIYLAGVSLAGPGVFVTTYLDEQSQFRNQKASGPFLAGVQLFCPLVNFQQTFEQHEKPSAFSAFVDLWNYRRFKAYREMNPALNNFEWWNTLLDLKPRFMPALLSWAQESTVQPILKLDTFQKKFPKLVFPPVFIEHLKNNSKLLPLQNFWPFYKNEITPISVYVTPHDPAVMNSLNSDKIRNYQQPGVFKKISFTDLQGVHCGLASEYQWPFLVELLKKDFQDK